MVRGDPHPRCAGADAELKWGSRWMASPSLPAGARCHGVRTMSNSSHAWRGGVLGGRAPGNLPRTWRETVAGHPLPSERTEGRPKDQLAWFAMWLDVAADAVSAADAPERSRTTARFARARHREQYSTVR